MKYIHTHMMSLVHLRIRFTTLHRTHLKCHYMCYLLDLWYLADVWFEGHASCSEGSW